MGILVLLHRRNGRKEEPKLDIIHIWQELIKKHFIKKI